jgi:high-affinity iron transporter
VPARYVFSVTGTLMTLLAAGLAAQAAQLASAAGVVTVLDQVAWNTSRILPEDGMLGRVLHTLIGYTANPTQLQLVVYAATILGMVVLTRVAAARRQPGRPVAPTAA